MSVITAIIIDTNNISGKRPVVAFDVNLLKAKCIFSICPSICSLNHSLFSSTAFFLSLFFIFSLSPPSQKKRRIAEQKQPLLERSRISDRGADLLLLISYDHRSGHLFNELGI
ncbi:hypothetical protein MRB53_020480 [Persea americana]|uniref:Uncharacterized protein n=1 Tax=Persea americana TaxID=3435 RepID=A0ACC2L1P2_PERAE|nr:hypothetical protein MRB53_020480 [Persea americana]